MIQNIAVDESCQACSGTSFVVDSISGDTICDTCGLCRNDVQLDCYGNSAPEAGSRCVQEMNQTMSARSLRKKLDIMYLEFDVNPSFEQYSHDCVAHVEQSRFELRGIKSDHVCLAVIYQTHLHHAVFFDMVEACRYINAFVGRIKLLAERLFGGVQNNSLHDTTDDKKMQNFIYKASQDLEIPIKTISGKLIATLKTMPKSTKMKAAICMYIQDAGKLKDIVKYAKVQRSQLLKAVSETCRASGEPLPFIGKKTIDIKKPTSKKRKALTEIDPNIN